MPRKTPLNFEKAMSELEALVEDMEQGDLPLEKALKRFEEGVRLSKYCTETLDETERKVTLLLKDSAGNTVEKPFAAVESDA